MSKSFKIALAVLAIVVAGVLAYFLASSEAWQGALRRIKIPTPRARRLPIERIIKQQPKATELKTVTGLEQLTAKYVEEQFEKALDNMPSTAISGIPYKDYLRMKSYNEFIENKNRRDIPTKSDIFNKKIELLDQFGYPTEDPDPAEEDKNEFVLDLEAELEGSNWKNVPMGEGVPENYLYAFPLTPSVVLIDDETIDPDDEATWQTATAFAVCAVGEEAHTINSASFDSSGAPWFPATFQGYYSVLNTETQEFDYNQIWPTPVVNVGPWPGDISLPEPMELDPYSDHPCAVFAFRYIDIEPTTNGDSPAFYQFEFRGVRDQVPGDLDAYYLSGGDTLSRIGVPASETLKGTLNIFDSQNDVIVYDDDDHYLPILIGVESTGRIIGHFYTRTFPYTHADIESIEIEMVSSYGDDFSLDTKLEWDSNLWEEHYNNNEATGYEKNIVLHEGTNIIPFDFSMNYGAELTFVFSMDNAPSEPGNLQLFVKGVNGDVSDHKGSCWNYLGDSCSDPLDSVPLNYVNIANLEADDSFLRVNYSPSIYSLGALWFDQHDISYEASFDGDPATYHPDIFTANLQKKGALPGITVEPFDVEVIGNFATPLEVILHRQIMEEVPVEGSSTTSIEIFTDVTEHSVLPGDLIHIPEVALFQHPYMKEPFTYLKIVAQNIPSDSLLSAKNVRFKIADFDAIYDEAGISVLEGDSVPMFYNFEPLEFPIISERYYFGQDMLTAWSNFYMPPIETIDLSTFTGNDNEFAVNRGCVKAQGGVDLHEFTYRHFYRPDPPFKDIILETSENKIYFNDGIQGVPGAVKWFDDYVTFTLTNPEHLNYNESSCLSLTVEQPTEQIYGAWFHLTEVKGYNEQGELVPVYTEVMPEPATLEDDPIEGGVIDFLCDFFDENGECLY